MKKRIIIVGATSGIGLEVARIYKQQGWQLGLAGRRIELLETIQAEAPDQISISQIDVTDSQAPLQLNELIRKTGGMDIFLLCSGIGNQNRRLTEEIELSTLHTNVEGFTRMVVAAWHYFREQGGGHIAVVSSIAGTKGLGSAPSYSASKRYQNIYIDALSQLATMEKSRISFTDIRPGFVDTALLKSGHYPLLMRPEKVAAKIVKAIHRNKRRVIIDWRYALLVFFWKFIPQCLWERLQVSNRS